MGAIQAGFGSSTAPQASSSPLGWFDAELHRTTGGPLPGRLDEEPRLHPDLFLSTHGLPIALMGPPGQRARRAAHVLLLADQMLVRTAQSDTDRADRLRGFVHRRRTSARWRTRCSGPYANSAFFVRPQTRWLRGEFGLSERWADTQPQPRGGAQRPLTGAAGKSDGRAIS